MPGTATRPAAAGRLSDSEFDSEREELLASWPTGGEIDLCEAIAFHRSLSAEKDATHLFTDAASSRTPLVYPRTGEADLDAHISTLLRLHREGAQLLCTHADSYTRTLRYREAQETLDESLARGSSLLNGVPVVNYGARRMRDVVLQTPIANQYRQGTPDGRLASETVFAAGYRSMLGGILGSIPHMRDLPIGECIRNWQYVDRLVGRYGEEDVTLHREYYGALMGMVVPPSLMCSCLVLDALLAAEQGVRHLTLGVNNNLHLHQDVATVRVLQELAREYLDRYSFHDVECTTLMHMWMGAFPQEPADAYALIGLGAFAAAYGGAAAVIVKTADEAFGCPSVEANALATRMTRACVDIAARQSYPDSDALSAEMDLIERETRAILDATLNAGDGSVGPAIEQAFGRGVIDIPLAPATCNAGRAMAARDATGAVRFYDTGALPFDPDIEAFHRRCMEDRAAQEGSPVTYKMLLRDVSMQAFDPVQLDMA